MHYIMESLTDKKLKEMELMATRLREDVIKMVSHADRAHRGAARHGGGVYRVLFSHSAIMIQRSRGGRIATVSSFRTGTSARSNTPHSRTPDIFR